MGAKQINNNLKHTIMTISELKRNLNNCFVNQESNNRNAWNLLFDLSCGFNGFNVIITIDNVNEYNCSLGNVETILDDMKVKYEIKGYGCDSGMYICFQICR